MEGISKHLRLRIASGLAALLAAAAVLMSMSASAQALCVGPFCAKEVSVELVNNSHVAVFAQICPKAHASNPGNSQESPCHRITYSNTIGANGQRQTFGPFNPMGLIVSPAYPFGVCEKAPCPFGSRPALNRTLNFYIKNPLIGKPYVRVQGHEIPLVEGQTRSGHLQGFHLEIKRSADADRNGNSVKVITITIGRWPA